MLQKEHGLVKWRITALNTMLFCSSDYELMVLAAMNSRKHAPNETQFYVEHPLAVLPEDDEIH